MCNSDSSTHAKSNSDGITRVRLAKVVEFSSGVRMRPVLSTNLNSSRIPLPKYSSLLHDINVEFLVRHVTVTVSPTVTVYWSFGVNSMRSLLAS